MTISSDVVEHEATDVGKTEPIPEEGLGHAITFSTAKWENARGIRRAAKPANGSEIRNLGFLESSAPVDLVKQTSDNIYRANIYYA